MRMTQCTTTAQQTFVLPRRVQCQLTLLPDWLKKWQVAINMEKYEAIAFSHQLLPNARPSPWTGVPSLGNALWGIVASLNVFPGGIKDQLSSPISEGTPCCWQLWTKLAASETCPIMPNVFWTWMQCGPVFARHRKCPLVWISSPLPKKL